MVFAVVVFGIGEFVGVGFGVFGVVEGFLHAADVGFKGHVFVLPFQSD